MRRLLLTDDESALILRWRDLPPLTRMAILALLDVPCATPQKRPEREMAKVANVVPLRRADGS